MNKYQSTGLLGNIVIILTCLYVHTGYFHILFGGMSTEFHFHLKKNWVERNLQDGRGVRRGDHLSPHKHIKNTSTCGTTPTEHLLNPGRRPQTFQKARNSPCAWVGQKKKEKNRDKRIETGPAPLGGSCEGRKVSTH